MNAAAAPARIEPDPIDRVAHALADGTRRRLLRLVRDGERAAGELATEFPAISRPAVSQHLRVLETAGLVTVRPDGNRRLYRARAAGLEEVWRFIDEMWSVSLDRLKHAAEREAARTGSTAGSTRATT